MGLKHFTFRIMYLRCDSTGYSIFHHPALGIIRMLVCLSLALGY